MTPAMYIFLNSALGMSTGKAAAQAAHASPFAERMSRPDLLDAWYVGGHYMKLVMDGGDALAMWTIKVYLEQRDFKVKMIIDEGRTEDTYMVPTALGVEVVDKDDPHVAATFSSFKLLRDKPQVTILEHTKALSLSQVAEVRKLVERGEIGMARDAMRGYAELNRAQQPQRSWPRLIGGRKRSR